MERSAPTSPHLPLDPSTLHLSSLSQPDAPALLLSHPVSLKKKNPLPGFSPAFSFYHGLFFLFIGNILSLLLVPLFCQLQLENTVIAFS